MWRAFSNGFPGAGDYELCRVHQCWRRHAADLETEIIKRGMIFTVIDWD
jgi:hypothetical protein